MKHFVFLFFFNTTEPLLRFTIHLKKRKNGSHEDCIFLDKIKIKKRKREIPY